MVPPFNSNHHLPPYILLILMLSFNIVFTEVPSEYLKTYIPLTTDIISTNYKTTTISESQDIGNCTCNLLPRLCDYHCCCDEDCEEVLRTEWKDAKVCKDKGKQGFYNDFVDNTRMKDYLCDNENATYYFNNNQSGLVYKDQVANLLCVTWDNSRDMGEFYLDPTAVPINNLILNMTNQYNNWWRRYYTDYTDIGTNGYAYGDPIKVADNGIQVNNNLYMYQADASGNCRWNKVVRFNMTMKTTCNYDATNKDSTLPVLLKIEIITGGTPFPLLNTITNSAYLHNSDLTLIQPAAGFDETHYAESLKIRFYITANNIISKIVSTLVYVTLTGSKPRLKQTYEIQWFTDTSTDLELKSGNPGYFYKKPVRFLTATSKSPYNVNENGVYIRGRDPTNGNCLASPSNVYNINDEPILFGVDSVYSCNIPTTKPIPSSYLISDIQNSIQTIGRFGSSNPAFTQDWKQTEGIQTNTPNLAIADDRTIILEILTSKFGPKSKPQLYILSSKLIIIDEPSTNPTKTIRFITKFIPVSYDQLIKSDQETSLPPFPNTINKNIP